MQWDRSMLGKEFVRLALARVGLSKDGCASFTWVDFQAAQR